MSGSCAPLRNCFVLFVPHIADLTVGKMRDELKETFIAADMYKKHLYLPFLDRSPESFVKSERISLRIRKTSLRLSFIENKVTASRVCYEPEHVLFVPIKIENADAYPPDLLVTYFKNNWLQKISL